MAISTNAVVDFFGTADQIDSTPSSIADDAISVAADISEWTNDDDATHAGLWAEFTWTTAPVINTTIDVHAQLMNVNGTEDSEAPQFDYPSMHIGSFQCNDTETTQNLFTEVDLPNAETSQVYQFYLVNRTGQSITDFNLIITPKAEGLHA